MNAGNKSGGGTGFDFCRASFFFFIMFIFFIYLFLPAIASAFTHGPVGLICRAAEIQTKNRTHVQASQRHNTPPAKVEGSATFFIRMLRSRALLVCSLVHMSDCGMTTWVWRRGLCQSIAMAWTAGFENIVAFHEWSVIQSKTLMRLHCRHLPAGCSSSSLHV